jgi:excisionase family DNA binding protein
VKDPSEWEHRISVDEIAKRMDIGRAAVYDLLARGLMPGIRVNRRWIISRRAYLAWEEAGTSPAPVAGPRRVSTRSGL